MQYIALNSTPPTARMPPAEGLDRPADYLDENGNPRRSNKITQRMVMRGVVVGTSSALQFAEQEAATEVGQAASSMQDQDPVEARKEKLSQVRAERAAARQELIDIHNQIIETRIEAWYSRDFVPNDGSVDTTDTNTAKAPSNSLAFLDDDGNIRRKKPEEQPPLEVPNVTPPVPVEIPVENPSDLPPEQPLE